MILVFIISRISHCLVRQRRRCNRTIIWWLCNLISCWIRSIHIWSWSLFGWLSRRVRWFIRLRRICGVSLIIRSWGRRLVCCGCSILFRWRSRSRSCSLTFRDWWWIWGVSLIIRSRGRSLFSSGCSVLFRWRSCSCGLIFRDWWICSLICWCLLQFSRLSLVLWLYSHCHRLILEPDYCFSHIVPLHVQPHSLSIFILSSHLEAPPSIFDVFDIDISPWICD